MSLWQLVLPWASETNVAVPGRNWIFHCVFRPHKYLIVVVPWCVALDIGCSSYKCGSNLHVWKLYKPCVLVSFPGHSQILSHSRWEKLGEGLVPSLCHGWTSLALLPISHFIIFAWKGSTLRVPACSYTYHTWEAPLLRHVLVISQRCT